MGKDESDKSKMRATLSAPTSALTYHENFDSPLQRHATANTFHASCFIQAKRVSD